MGKEVMILFCCIFKVWRTKSFCGVGGATGTSYIVHMHLCYVVGNVEDLFNL